MSPTKIPVIVLTGFLGSGKTTLLNKLLADGPKTAVIINEFGSQPVDQDLLDDQTMPLTVLSGGCLCCQIKGALAPTLKNLWMTWNSAEDKPFERVIIETSGVASPEPILDTLLREPWLCKRYRLEAVITTLAQPSAMAQLQQHAEALAQVVWADSLLLTHADLVNPEQQAQLRRYLQAVAPATPSLSVNLAIFEVGYLQGLALPAFRRLPEAVNLPEHGFRSVSLYWQTAPNWLDLQAVLQGLLCKYAPSLVRIKGVIYEADGQQALVIQAAGGRLYPPRPLAPSANQDGRSRLVLITMLDPQALADELLSNLGFGLAQNGLRLH